MTFSADKTPTRVRYGVLAFVCVLSMITYLDRAALPNVQDRMLDALGLATVDDLTIAFTAFNLAYALFEVPTGYLGDRFGPRMTLIRVVLWWSFFIALTALVGNLAGVSLFGSVTPALIIFSLPALVVIRFLFGVGEAGAYPNINKALHNWLPLRERGLGSGMVWMSARFMGGLTPLIMTLLLTRLHLHWRAMFLLFGLMGVVWCIGWAYWFRNRPEEKPEVNAAERALIAHDASTEEPHHGVPWQQILSNRSVWVLCLMYFCTNYGWYFSMNYLPAFMQNHYAVEKESFIGSIYKGGPLLLGTAGCLFGGLLTDHYVRRTGDRRWGRRLYGIVGHLLTGLCMIVTIFIPTRAEYAFAFALTIALAGFFNDMTMASSWASCQDVGGRYSAMISGCMNMIGNLGGALTTLMSGLIVRWQIQAAAGRVGVTEEVLKKSTEMLPLRLAAERDGWHINFALYAGFYLLAVVFWLMLDVTKPVIPVREARG
jgi:MFS family permease